MTRWGLDRRTEYELQRQIHNALEWAGYEVRGEVSASDEVVRARFDLVVMLYGDPALVIEVKRGNGRVSGLTMAQYQGLSKCPVVAINEIDAADATEIVEALIGPANMPCDPDEYYAWDEDKSVEVGLA